MLQPKRILLAALGWALLSATATPAQTNTPSYVAAEYHPGYGRTYAWRATVSSSGRVKQEVKTEQGMFAPDQWAERVVSPLRREQVHALFEALASVEFCTLDARYSPVYRVGDVITDLATLVLEVSVEGRRCRVEVYGGDEITRVDGHPKKVDARRFCAAWGQFLAVVPAPNRWQTAGTCA